MPFNNGKGEPMGVVNNPLTNSLFSQGFEEGGTPIPPGTEFMITESGDFMVTESGNRMITE